MLSAPAPLSATDAFALIMERLCQTVAAQSYRERMAAPLILLIWTRLRRLAARFAALAARVRAGTLRSRAPARRAASRPASPPASPPPPRLPNDFAWLVRLVGWRRPVAGRSCSISWPTRSSRRSSPPRRRWGGSCARSAGCWASMPPPCRRLPGTRHRRSSARAPDQIPADQAQPGRTPADTPAATPLAGTPGRSPDPGRERAREVRLPAPWAFRGLGARRLGTT